MPKATTRTLATVMFTDIVGFTALMQQDEALARQQRDRHRQVLERSHQTHHGEIINYFGDGSLSIFNSAVEAVTCAVEIQQQLRQPPQVELRIGIHMGDVILERESVFGDTVNVASRIESFSVPGAVLVSGVIYDQVKNHSAFDLRQLGKFKMKNVARPVELFAVAKEALIVPKLADLQGKGEYIDEAKALLHNIPHPISSFVGRQKEIKEINTLLSQNRLVTLTGPGGTGKTRLSQQVAHKAALHFPDGVYWIPLAALSDPGLVAFTIAKGLQLEQDTLLSIEEVLIRFLKGKKILLLLDNFEQVVAAAPLIEQLLRQCPKLKILVTSRIVLQLIGEVEYAVKPLPLPKNGTSNTEQLKQYPAIQLFYDRARTARKGFGLNEENAAAVAEICKRLDGLPLAIELAAARIKIFSPKAMLKKLQQRLDLKSSSSSLPSRHQTIRSTIAWSYDLLNTEEKELFSRMSVFVGGANMEAVEEICGVNGLGGWDVVDGVLALVDKSLLQQEEDEELEARFTMLETIREFASESLKSLAKQAPLQQAHARYFMELAEEANPHLSGSEHREWLALLEAEQENFRSAINNSISLRNYETAFRLGLALRPFWGNRGMMTEGMQQLEQLLELPAENELYQWRLKVMQALGVLYMYVPKLAAAKKMFSECLVYWRKADNSKQIGLTLNHLAWVTCGLAQTREGDSYNQEAIEIWKQTEDVHNLTPALNNKAWIQISRCQIADAIATFEENMRIIQSLSNERRYAYAMDGCSFALFLHGRYQEAIQYQEQALSLHQRSKDKLGMGYSHGQLAFYFCRIERFTEVEQHLLEAERLEAEVQSHMVLLLILDQKTLLAFSENKLEEAKLWSEQALELAEKTNAYRFNCHVWITALRIALTEKDLETATTYLDKLVQLDQNQGSFLGIIPALEFKARICVEERALELAVLCLAKATSLREEFEFKLLPIDAPAINDTKKRLQEAVGVEKYDRLWQQGRQAALESLIDNNGEVDLV